MNFGFHQDSAKTSGFLLPLPQGERFTPAVPLQINRESVHITVEFALLVKCGLSIDIVFEAMEQAAVQGVSLDEFAIAEGLVSDELLYATLAAHLRRPFVMHAVNLANRNVPRVQVSAGVALVRERAADYRYLIAPRGKALRALLQDRNNRRADVAITTPAHLLKLVREQSHKAVTHEASLGLWQNTPSMSALEGLSRAQFGFCGGAIFAASFAAALDWRMAFDSICLCAGGLFFSLVVLRMIAIWMSEPQSPDEEQHLALPDFALPHYSIVVALYKEARIARKLASALAAIDYPKAKLDIIIVLEEEDHETQAAFARLGLPPRFQVVIAPNGRPRTKPRALNVALPFVRGEFVAVFDAEDEPDADQLRKAAAKFSANKPDLACVQAQLVIENHHESLFSKLFAIEYATLFDVIIPGLAAMGLAFPLGGTSNHFRGVVQQSHQN